MMVVMNGWLNWESNMNKSFLKSIDRENSKQVILWQKFCEKNCRNFYNSFDSFFALKKQLGVDKLIADYFILNDVHHSKNGAEVIAKDFIGK